MGDPGTASNAQEIQNLHSTISSSVDGNKPFGLMAALSAVPGKEDQLQAILNAMAKAATDSVRHPGGGVDFIVRER